VEHEKIDPSSPREFRQKFPQKRGNNYLKPIVNPFGARTPGFKTQR